MERKCDNCGILYKADKRALKRGWGLCCSKKCAASKREKSKPGYDPKRVERNNLRRETYPLRSIDTNHYGTFTGRYSEEGYKLYKDEKGLITAVDEFDYAVYTFS